MMVEDCGLLSFDAVQERLVEAYGFLMRLPDRERSFLCSQGVSSIWREVGLTESEAWSLYQIDSDDYHRDALPKLPGLTTVEISRMEEALGWMAYAPQRDRKLVGIVLGQLQRDARPSWRDAAALIGGDTDAKALARRYERTIGAVCRAVNAGNSRPSPRQPQ